MNWNRAKDILIILFVFINIFLVVYLINTFPWPYINQATLENTKLVLEERNITLLCKIPYDIPKMSTYGTSIPQNEATSSAMIVSGTQVDGYPVFLPMNILPIKTSSETVAGIQILEQKRYVMPITQVLLKNFVYQTEKIIIQDIHLGYLRRNIGLKETSILYMPVWKITFNNGIISYFKAFTGDKV